jgi:hypothetical protein
MLHLLDLVFWAWVGVFIWWFWQTLMMMKWYRRVVVGEKDMELEHILKGEGER